MKNDPSRPEGLKKLPIWTQIGEKYQKFYPFMHALFFLNIKVVVVFKLSAKNASEGKNLFFIYWTKSPSANQITWFFNIEYLQNSLHSLLNVFFLPSFILIVRFLADFDHLQVFGLLSKCVKCTCFSNSWVSWLILVRHYFRGIWTPFYWFSTRRAPKLKAFIVQ